MLSIKLISLFGLAMGPLSMAHFIVNIPPPLGSDINNEDIAPCGGFTPSSSSNRTDFHVQGDAISLTTLHAQSYLAYRGLLGTSVSSSPNWTALIPTVEEFGLNSFCEPSIAVPASWAGKAGLLQIIQDAEDGVHYQCMAVNFIAGLGTPSSACSNSSGVSATFADDNTLDGIEGGAAVSSTASQTAQATQSSTSTTQASPSHSKSAALLTARPEIVTSGLLSGFITLLLSL
ncbi:hypothetical protein F5884DRAFT_667629 [Xylogone sp. PMI_703]|nr:hypothetical protein F5884DRAFT_667629 [Xylogone sp. PMI_703]